MTTSTEPVQRQAASSAVNDLGWRYLYASLGAAVRVASPTEALELIARLVEALGPDFDEHLRVDLRPGCVELVLATREVGNVTARDVELAGAVTAAVRNLGLTVEPGSVRGVQTFEIAIDALDIARDPAVLEGGAGLRRRPAGRRARQRADRPAVAVALDLVPADGRAAPAAQPHPLRRLRRPRRGRGAGWQLRWPRAGRSSPTPRRRRSGCSPTPRATRSASAPGRAATERAGAGTGGWAHA